MDRLSEIKTIVHEALTRIITLETKLSYQKELDLISKTLLDSENKFHRKKIENNEAS